MLFVRRTGVFREPMLNIIKPRNEEMGNKVNNEKDTEGGAIVVSDVFYYEQRDCKGRLKSFQGKKLKNKNRIIILFKRLLHLARV